MRKGSHHGAVLRGVHVGQVPWTRRVLQLVHRGVHGCHHGALALCELLRGLQSQLRLAARCAAAIGAWSALRPSKGPPRTSAWLGALMFSGRLACPAQ